MPIELRLTKAFECKSGSESGDSDSISDSHDLFYSLLCSCDHQPWEGVGGGHRKTVLFIGTGAHRSHTYAHKTNPEIHDIQTETQICVRGHCVNYRR